MLLIPAVNVDKMSVFIYGQKKPVCAIIIRSPKSQGVKEQGRKEKELLRSYITFFALVFNVEKVAEMQEMIKMRSYQN